MSPPPSVPLAVARPLLAAALLACGVACGGAEDASGADAAAEAPAVDARGRSFEEVRNEAFRLHEGGEDPAIVLEALRAAHALDPTAYGVNRRLGQVYGDLKLYVEALAHYRLAREAKPEAVEDGLAVVRLLLALDRRDEALAALEPLLEHEATRGEALYHRARILDFRGDREGALAVVAQAEELPPREAYHAVSLHGRFLMERGAYAEAETLFRRALDGRSDYKEALRGMADACRRQGRHEEADHWDRVLGLFLDLTDNVFVRKRPAERRRTLRGLVAEYPEWTPAFQQLAAQLRREGDLEGACDVMEVFIASRDDLTPEEIAAIRARFCPEGSR